MKRFGYHSIFDLHNEYHSLTATIYNKIFQLLNIKEWKHFDGSTYLEEFLCYEAVGNLIKYVKKLRTTSPIAITKLTKKITETTNLVKKHDKLIRHRADILMDEELTIINNLQLAMWLAKDSEDLDLFFDLIEAKVLATNKFLRYSFHKRQYRNAMISLNLQMEKWFSQDLKFHQHKYDIVPIHQSMHIRCVICGRNPTFEERTSIMHQKVKLTKKSRIRLNGDVNDFNIERGYDDWI